MRYAMVPEALIGAKVSHRAYRVLTAIILHADRRSGECHPTDNRLAEITGIGIRKVREDVAELVETGLIRRLGHTSSRTLEVPQLRPESGLSDTDAQNGPKLPPDLGPERAVAADQLRPESGLALRPDSGLPIEQTRNTPENTPPGGGGEEVSDDPDRAELVRVGKELDRLMGSVGWGSNLHRFRGPWPLAWWLEAFRIMALMDRRPGRPWMYASSMLKRWEVDGGPPKPKPSQRREAQSTTNMPPPKPDLSPEERLKLRREAEAANEVASEERRALLAANPASSLARIWGRQQDQAG
jgi:hypothetical protein